MHAYTRCEKNLTANTRLVKLPPQKHNDPLSIERETLLLFNFNYNSSTEEDTTLFFFFFFFTYLKEQIFCINTSCFKGDEGKKSIHLRMHRAREATDAVKNWVRQTRKVQQGNRACSDLTFRMIADVCSLCIKKFFFKALDLLWAKLRCNAIKPDSCPACFSSITPHGRFHSLG